jgi:hypothetical protein
MWVVGASASVGVAAEVVAVALDVEAAQLGLALSEQVALMGTSP